MEYPVNLAGFEGMTIVVQTAGLFSGPKLLINGHLPPKGPKRGQMLLHRNDGREIIASWKPQFMGLDVPRLVVDGTIVNVAEPLKWYVWAWCALPAILIVSGGAVGALSGAVGSILNLLIIRSPLPGLAKFLLTGLVSLFSFIAFVVLASLLLAAIGR